MLDFLAGLNVPPFFSEIVLPAVVGGAVLIIILNKVLESWGYTLW
jgi:hypothetical protein